VRTTLELPIAADRLRAVLTDFEAFPVFVPWVQQVEVLRALAGPCPGWEVRVQLCVVRPWCLTLLVQQPDPNELRWSLIEGPFASVEGRLRLEPAAPSPNSRLELDLEVQAGLYVPLPLMRSVESVELNDLLRRVGERAEE